MSRTPYSLNSYTGGAQALYLASSGIGAADTTLTLSGSTASWSPLGTTGGWYLSVGYGTANEEKMFVPSGSWNYTNNYVTLSGITRGIDYTTAVAQSGGVTCIPVITSTDISEANYAANLLYNGGTTGPLVISGKVTINGNATISGMTITGGTTTSGYVLTATSPSGSTWTAPVGATLPTAAAAWNGTTVASITPVTNNAFITANYNALPTATLTQLAFLALPAGTWLVMGRGQFTYTTATLVGLDLLIYNLSTSAYIAAGTVDVGQIAGGDARVGVNVEYVVTLATASYIALGAYPVYSSGSVNVINGSTELNIPATGLTAVRIA